MTDAISDVLRLHDERRIVAVDEEAAKALEGLRSSAAEVERLTAGQAVIEAARQWKEARELAHEFGGRFARERVGGFERDLVDALAALARSLSTPTEDNG